MKRLFEKDYVSRINFPQLEITENGLTLLDDVVPFWQAAQLEANKKLGNIGKEALSAVLTQLTK